MDFEVLFFRIHNQFVGRKEQLHPFGLEQAAIALEGARIALEVLARLELQAVDEDADRHGAAVAAREPHERKMPGVEVPHGRHERHRPRRGDGGAQGGSVAQDLHHPRLKNSRRLFMARTRDTSSSKSASRSTKLRFSEFTMNTGAAS